MLIIIEVKNLNALTLFSGIGVDEFYLSEIGINLKISNEISPIRAKIHSHFFPDSEMFQGDINNEKLQNEITEKAKEQNINFVLITPPCQGVSTAGKNKTMESLQEDPRNYLITSALKIVDELMPKYILIENVPRYNKLLFPYKDELLSLQEILIIKYGQEYNIEMDILDAADYGVPQYRKRVIYRLWKKEFNWELPLKEKHIPLIDAIGTLPSLKPGETSSIKNHYARTHPENQILSMKHTPPGKSALKNEEYPPRKINGELIKGYGNTYKRMRWEYPAPTITMRNEIISSQENVHPGRPNSDGTWSDPRVLTLREILIVSTLPEDLDVPDFVSETAFRQLIGEGVPPLFIKKLISGIEELQNE